MSVRTFKVILDNDVKEQTFNVKCDSFTSDSFLRILKLSGFISEEISDECFVDDTYYHKYTDVNFDSDFKVLKLYTLSYSDKWGKNDTSISYEDCITPQTSTTNTASGYYDYYGNPLSSDEIKVASYWYDRHHKLHRKQPPVDVEEQNELGFNVVLETSYDSDVLNASPEKPRRIRNKTPRAPRKRNRREVSDSEDDSDDSDDVMVEDGSDESHVESMYCIQCFGFDSSTDNPIVMCKNRNCSVACHKNCSEFKVFKCNVHNKKDKVCRKLF